MTRWVVGVDGGGSKTEAWVASVADDGTLTTAGKGTSGPSNPRVFGYSAAQQAIYSAMHRACEHAHISVTDLAAGCFALAGAGREEEQYEVSRRLAARGWHGALRFVHDGWAALATAFQPVVGIVLIAGTGSFAFGRNARQEEQRVGGWGYLFGDEGSGYDLGRAALRAVAMSVDGRIRHTSLVAAVLKHYDLKEPSQLIECVYSRSTDRSLIALLAPLVLSAARQRDFVADSLVDRAAEQLAQHVSTLARRLDFSPQALPLAFAGGVLVGSDILRDRVKAKLAAWDFRVPEPKLVTHPAEGATRLAADLLQA